ncbi:CPBP family intramembrane glutamic endopeptidase [Paenibacillus thiaminolyticus]|uniref:CPBP family glutamic-type intramembrane protease n=1 Tax=Paenibacillus thiaminolyticus TaxID=49283 RepID=UPI003D2C4DD6
MFPRMNDTIKALTYGAIVLLLGIGFAFLPQVNTLLYMMTPAIAALLMMFLVTGEGWRKPGWTSLGLFRFGWRGMLPALVIPLAIMLLSYGTVWLAGLADIHIPDQFGGYPWSCFPLILFATFLGNIVTTSLGEELGWRGYWLPLLVRACGERRAYLINGFIHGVWHLPIIWLTGLYHSEQAPWYASLMIVLSCLALAPVIGRLRLRTDSVWPASVLHTAHNLSWNVLSGVTAAGSPLVYYISGDNSLMITLCYGMISLFIWARTGTARTSQSADR